MDRQSIAAQVQRTRAPARVHSYQGMPGQLAARMRELGIRSGVGAPVIVDGSVWGALIVTTASPQPLPAGTELRLARFADLIGTAVSNATARSELIESRARMITAFDAARRRVTRDLHDGAQQRFVSAIINLQLAQQNWSSTPHKAKDLLDLALRDASSGLQELREIAAGIHPAILTHRGLAAVLEALAARLPIPVELDVTDRRLPEAIESSIYFFCSEALTNVVKHARAGSAWVRVALEGDRCTAEVRDDGIGGADSWPRTSGLIGLRDRIGALKGAIEISSPAAGGTVLRAWSRCPPNRARLSRNPRLSAQGPLLGRVWYGQDWRVAGRSGRLVSAGPDRAPGAGDRTGPGGQPFGSVVTWFLLGGDLYTAYTFIAVPALVFGVGAVGFFAVPNAIIVFPIVFVFAPRLWLVSPVHGYITPANSSAAATGPRPGTGRGRDRHPGHDALHRPAAGRHPGRAHRARGGR